MGGIKTADSELFLEEQLIQAFNRRSSFIYVPAELFYSKEGTGTFQGTVANLVNSAVGAGMLTLPVAFQSSGMALGTIMLILFGLLVTYSLHQIGRCQKKTSSKTYQEVVGRYLGDRAELACIGIQIVFIFGICVGMLDIIPDQLQPVLASWVGQDSIVGRREVIIICVAVFILLPMMFIRNIQKLSPIATFSVCANFYIVGMFLYRAYCAVADEGLPSFVAGEPEPTVGSQISLVRYSLDIIKAVPLFGSAYFVHITYPLVFWEMRKKKLSRSATSMDSATSVSMMFCFLVYLLVGSSGLIYGVIRIRTGTIPGDAFKMFPDSPEVIIARLCIAMSVTASYITLHFACSKCFEDLFVKGQPGGFNSKQRSCEVVTFLTLTACVAMVVKQLDVVLGVIGSLTVVPIMFVIPGFLQVENDWDNDFRKNPFKNKYNGYFFITLGTVLSIAGLIVTLKSQ